MLRRCGNSEPIVDVVPAFGSSATGGPAPAPSVAPEAVSAYEFVSKSYARKGRTELMAQNSYENVSFSYESSPENGFRVVRTYIFAIRTF